MDALITRSHLATAIRRAVVLIACDDVEFVVNDRFTQTIVEATADAICEYAVELDIADFLGSELRVEALRNVVRALRFSIGQRETRPSNSFTSCAILADALGIEGIAEFDAMESVTQ